MQLDASLQQNNLKKVFWLLALIIIIIMPLLSSDYGQSGDEWLQIEYGEHIWNYFKNDDQQALNYENKPLQYQNQQLYGGVFDYPMEVLHRTFPNMPVLVIRHFFNALMGALMMLFTGLFAYRLSRNWMVGILGLLFMVFSPRIFGESMNNPKDIPMAAGFIMGVYFWLAMLQDFPKRKWGNAVGLAVGFMIAFGSRSAGGLLQLAYFGVITALYYFTNKEFRERLKANNGQLFKSALLFAAGAVIVGYTISILVWPYGRQSPISNPLASLAEMANRSVTLTVFFEGAYRPNSTMPWYYEFKWICMSNPAVVIIGCLLFAVLFSQVKKQYGSFVLWVLLFAALFPLVYAIYKKSSVYDTWRHFFFVYPFWAAMGALGWSLVSNFLSAKLSGWLPFAVAVLGLAPAIIWTIKEHPNQYVYFNEFVGGIKGANGYYDTDYYQNSALQDAEWIIKNAKKIPGRKIVVGSNMLGFDKYFAKDTSWITWAYVRYPERHQKEWDYYVTYGRFVPAEQLQNGKWPPANAVYTVEAGGVPLSAVLQRKSSAGLEAYNALQKQDFQNSARLYAEYLKEDASDDNAWANYGIALASIGQIDAGINAINQAINLDGRGIQLYEILEKLYQAKGDMQGAQQASMRKNAAIMKSQEFSE